jgi:hypothetical protein
VSHRITLIVAGFLLASVTFYTAGCNRSAEPVVVSSPESEETKTSDSRSDREHDHRPGIHGGTIVSIGLESYHAEAVFEQGGVLKLFMLGQDESRVIDVESQTLTAYVKGNGDMQAVSMQLQAEPQAGDREGRTSLFVGTLPESLAGLPVQVTIPNITISGERFRIAFASTGNSHGDAMPDKVADAEERELYLTAAGKYTQADIEANGNRTASQKFKGFRAAHDFRPQPGDKICPVTLTKAHPQCTWIVGGKEYEFCCPPCVDEFVTLAKEDGEIKDPEDYVKQ